MQLLTLVLKMILANKELLFESQKLLSFLINFILMAKPKIQWFIFDAFFDNLKLPKSVENHQRFCIDPITNLLAS